MQKKEEKTVVIKIPIERDNKGDKVVWVNDRRFLIKRGIPVEVPVEVAEILDHEEEMLQQRYEFESKMQTE